MYYNHQVQLVKKSSMLMFDQFCVPLMNHEYSNACYC